MRNIIIIIACICFISSVKSESSIITPDECRESCKNLTNNDTTEKLTGFVIEGKCHCMESFVLDEYQDESFKKIDKKCPDCNCNCICGDCKCNYGITEEQNYRNNTNNVYGSCEYNCVINDNCKRCFENFNPHTDECNKCINCIRECQYQNTVKIDENTSQNTTSINKH